MDIAPDGRLTGIDGLLDQISAALARQVGPILTNDVLPAIQRDQQLQRIVGEGIGRGAAQQLRGPAWLLAGSVGVLAVAAWRKPGSSHALPFVAGAGAGLALCWLLSRR